MNQDKRRIKTVPRKWPFSYNSLKGQSCPQEQNQGLDLDLIGTKTGRNTYWHWVNMELLDFILIFKNSGRAFFEVARLALLVCFNLINFCGKNDNLVWPSPSPGERSDLMPVLRWGNAPTEPVKTSSRQWSCSWDQVLAWKAAWMLELRGKHAADLPGPRCLLGCFSHGEAREQQSKGDRKNNYGWGKPGTHCCSPQTICLIMKIFSLISEIEKARAPAPLSTLYVLMSPVRISHGPFLKGITSPPETFPPSLVSSPAAAPADLIL